MADLKEAFENDKRGMRDMANFVEQLDEATAIIGYYGMGDTHEGKYFYDPALGWKFIECYDRYWENLSDEGKVDFIKRLATGFKNAGFTEIKETDDGIEIIRKEGQNG